MSSPPSRASLSGVKHLASVLQRNKRLVCALNHPRCWLGRWDLALPLQIPIIFVSMSSKAPFPELALVSDREKGKQNSQRIKEVIYFIAYILVMVVSTHGTETVVPSVRCLQETYQAPSVRCTLVVFITYAVGVQFVLLKGC